MPDEPQPKPPSKYKKDWKQADALGKFIIEKLIENRLTKNELAWALEIDRGRLPALLTGTRAITGPELDRIAAFLRVPLLELVQPMFQGEQSAEIIYFVDTYLRLSEEEQSIVNSTLEMLRSRHLGEAESPSNLLARRQRRSSPGDE